VSAAGSSAGPTLDSLAGAASVRARLWDAGFRPIPIYSVDHPIKDAGKRPIGDDWRRRALRDPPEAVDAPPELAALNTGILCDGLRPIDLDVDDPRLAARLRALAIKHLGETIIRTRANSGRCLLVYRAAQGQPRKVALSGQLGKVEVLGAGQQFVAFGKHPSGAALQWTPEAPSETALENLPVVTEAQIEAFLMAAAPVIGAAPPRSKADGGHLNGQASLHPPAADALDVVAALSVIPNQGPADWESWNRVGMATWAATEGSTAGFAAWCAWSERHPAHDPAEARHRWEHYRTSPPTQIGAGTLFHLAREARPGWTKPSASSSKPAAQGHGQPPSAGVLWAEDSSWTEDGIPQRPWIAPGYALRGALTVVAGPPSASKSSLMVAYAVAAALGEPFHRFRPVGPMRVLIYNVEDDADEQRRRFSAVLRQFGHPPSALDGKVLRIGPSGVGTLAVYDDLTGRVTDSPAMVELRSRIEAFRPDLVILDPFAELHSAEENANTAVRAVLAFFRALAVEFKMAVILPHHTRKGVALAGDPDVARGASAIIGAARVVLTVTGMTEEEAAAFNINSDHRRHFFRVDGAKSNYAPPTDAEWFERIAYELDNGDQVAAPVSWKPPADVVSLDMRHAVESGIARGSPHGPWSPKLSTEPRSVRHLMVECGIMTADGQKQTLKTLLASGCAIADFRHSSRVVAKGLRSPDGEPRQALWIDAAA